MFLPHNRVLPLSDEPEYPPASAPFPPQIRFSYEPPQAAAPVVKPRIRTNVLLFLLTLASSIYWGFLQYQTFYNDEAARTCPDCGALHPGKEPPEGWVSLPPTGGN